jgi:hypothetical protein
MNQDTGPDSPQRTPGNSSTQSAMDLDSEHLLHSSPDPLNEPNGHRLLNPSHKRHNSSQDQLSQSRHQRNPTLFNFKMPVNTSESAKRMAMQSAAESEKECIEQARNLVANRTCQHQLGTSPQHLFWGHFHQNFDRNHQKPPPRHSISIPRAPQALVVGCSPAEVVLQRNFQLWCSQHRPHLILSDHHHLISPTPTPTPALPTLEAAQLHQFEPFLLGFLVS